MQSDTHGKDSNPFFFPPRCYSRFLPRVTRLSLSLCPTLRSLSRTMTGTDDTCSPCEQNLFFARTIPALDGHLLTVRLLTRLGNNGRAIHGDVQQHGHHTLRTCVRARMVCADDAATRAGKPSGERRMRLPSSLPPYPHLLLLHHLLLVDDVVLSCKCVTDLPFAASSSKSIILR